jgi:hypothetical protein
VGPEEWSDDELEPLAPLPAHERRWRHPSEVGAHEWQLSEPPLVIGRGLMLATSVVSGLLVFAVLWTTLPTRAGRGTVGSAGSTFVSLGGDSVLDLEATAQGTVALADGARPGSSDPAGLDFPDRSAATTTVLRPAVNAVPTVQVRHTSSDDTPVVTAGPAMVAVPVNGGTLLVTTAPAVAEGTMVEIEYASGSTGQAAVLLVDERHGLAILAPDPTQALVDESFEVADGATAGEQLTVLGAPEVEIVVGSGGLAAAEFEAGESVPEGAPVVNDAGQLVALCTHDDDGTARLVALDRLDQMRAALVPDAAAAGVWLGVVINDHPASLLVIGAVDPDGPAAVAGLVAGDVIIAADGIELSDCDALIGHLADLQPGATVLLTVRRSDGETAEVEVVLAEPRTAL